MSWSRRSGARKRGRVPKFRTLAADCPWLHRDTGIRGGTKRQYRTMSTAELCLFPIPRMADDAWLWMWCTHNHRTDAHAVAKAWGFDRYRSEGVWVKTSSTGTPRIGGGHTLRQAHEPFLLFSRGNPERLSKGCPSVILAPHPKDANGRIIHSAKPDEFYRLVDAFSPGPTAELFARRRWGNWTCLGDEMPAAAE